MFKLPDFFKRRRERREQLKRRQQLIEESDYGRRFGWFIERNGEKIGELDYLRWDWESQFWHDYRLTWHRQEDAVTGPDAWIAAELVLRNRRYTDVVIDLFLTSPERPGRVIAVRGATVSEEAFDRGD